MKNIALIILAVALLALTGCATATGQKLANDLTTFEKMGVTEIVITGKFSHTDYTVTHADGKRTAVINHSNVWVPQIKVVRVTPDAPATP